MAKNVLITGASGGIGTSIAAKCIEDGFHPILSARNLQKFNELAQNSATFFEMDLMNADIILEKVKQLPILDAVVLNAGIVKVAPLQYLKDEDLDIMMQTNLISNIKIIRALLKEKKLNKGASIVFISSISTVRATIANSVYNVTKGGLNAFTKSMALELAPKQIRVNAILPGFIETNILGGSQTESQHSKHLTKYPLGRFGKPEDVSEVVSFLISDKSSWITGSLIAVDGGFSLT